MPEEDRLRILRMEIPACKLRGNTGTGQWYDTNGINGWSLLDIAGNDFPYWLGSIDLSGYARDYKTVVPTGGAQQRQPLTTAIQCTDPEPPIEPVCMAGDGMLVYTVASTVPWDVEMLFYELAYSGGAGFIDMGDNVAGSPLPPLSSATGQAQRTWTTTIFGLCELWCPNRNIDPNTSGILTLVDSQQTGSLAPFASEVLYFAKIVLPLGDYEALTSLGIPAARIIFPSIMTQETDAEYMMRLSRSVELASNK